MSERYRPYREKQQIYALILVLIVLILALLFLRFVLGGDEDTWICKDGVWIEHGNPSSPMPNTKCN
jgi:hypothetical protein